jgi:hypothetical protein
MTTESVLESTTESLRGKFYSFRSSSIDLQLRTLQFSGMFLGKALLLPSPPPLKLTPSPFVPWVDRTLFPVPHITRAYRRAIFINAGPLIPEGLSLPLEVPCMSREKFSLIFDI